MDHGLHTLTERERQTLRLLLVGHDAKSIARDLGLSVHTINERLRDARGKLGVASSREAARLLAAAERDDPEKGTDKPLSVGKPALGLAERERPIRRERAGLSFVWLGGGMLIMSLVIAGAALLVLLHGSGEPSAAQTSTGGIVTPAADPASTRSAADWLALLDGQRWKQSWEAAGGLFRSQMTPDRWTAVAQGVRQPLGAVSSRAVQSSVRTTTLPGAPAGDYAVIQFVTAFARKPGAIETVILTHEAMTWKVNGYFVR